MAQPSASFYVLLALSKGPSHGLGIAEDVAEFTSGEVLLGPGTLYRCLKDLAAEGAVQRATVADPPGVTHRKHYRLTASGAAELRRILAGLNRLTAVARARMRRPQEA
jgi:DNA-binding PadR family transcriptional regulator